MRFLDESAASRPSLPALKAVSAATEGPARPDQAALDAHMARSTYGRFTLTEAVRPGWQLDIVPRAGYRHDAYVDPQSGSRMPALVAADSAENRARNTILHPASSADPCECENDSTEKDAQHDKMRALLRKHSIKGESHHRKDDDCHHPHVLISTKESKWRTHVGTLVPFGGFLF